MMRWFGHPGLRRLSGFADDEYGPEEAAAIREHLSDCGRCRRELAFIHELRAASRELSAPRPPAGLKKEILARWEAGERRILPLHDPPARPTRPRLAGPIGLGATLLLAVAIVVFLRVGDAAAGASELRLTPETLGAAQALAIEYRTPSELAGEERLRVRVRYRHASDFASGDRLVRARDGELERVRPGRFQGSLGLPDAAVYAAFAVEDLAGHRIDANGGRLWEVLARDDAGRPTFDALIQRMRALERVRWAEALATARLATELYPERVQGWLHRSLYEGLLLDGARRDSLVAAHRQRFTAFERSLIAEGEPEVDELAALVEYARALGEEEARARWTRRLEEVSPRHRLVVQDRVLEVDHRYRARPELRLRALEEEWERAGPSDPSLVQLGFQAALAHGAPDPILAWGDRLHRYAPEWAPTVAIRLSEVPELRQEGIARLRRELERLEAADPVTRPLDRSLEEHRAENRRQAARLLASLGRALAADGLDGSPRQARAARDALERAAAWSWSPELFRELADLHLSLGDTAAALRLLAFAAVDPLAAGPPSPGQHPGALVAPAEPAFPEALMGAGVERGEWERQLAEGRAELRRRVLARAKSRRIPADLRVTDGAGDSAPLLEVVGPGPALVVFWSHDSYPALRALPRLRDAMPLLASAGIRVTVIAPGQIVPEAEEPLRRSEVDLPLFFDPRHEVASALELSGTPLYVVVDREGRVRARHREMEEGLRLALVLARERQPAD